MLPGSASCEMQVQVGTLSSQTRSVKSFVVYWEYERDRLEVFLFKKLKIDFAKPKPKQ